MKKRPILFNTEMVRAILSGNKTQTRRITKLGISQNYALQKLVTITAPEKSAGNTAAIFTDTATGRSVAVECHFGKVGDQLWVRETHAFVNEPAYRRSTGVYQQINPNNNYQACVYKENFDRARCFPWKPSIHMPRWASRITLEITNIRVERLQDVTKESAVAEGCDLPSLPNQDWKLGARHNFMVAWDQIYSNWKSNPWVWVIEFKQVKNEENNLCQK